MIVDEHDFQAHLDYIHYNPVKHGHVSCAVEWPYSSLHRYIASGEFPEDWACDPMSAFDELESSDVSFGE